MVSWGKLCVVMSVATLLVGVSVFYGNLGGDRGGGGVREKEGRKLQAQIDEFKKTLGTLAKENEAARKGLAELALKKQELQVCTDNLAKSKREMKRCQKWATTIDDEKSAKDNELKATTNDLQSERAKALAMEKQATAVSEKLAQTKEVLASIEAQKEEATKKYEEEKKKEAELKAELEREVKKAGGTGKKSKRITDLEKMIGEMNDEFKAKETQMSELIDQKKSSDRTLRKLEGKLLEAGVDPKDIERVESGKGRNGGDQKSAAPPNPAALAAMQVAQSRGQAGDKPSKDGAIAKAEIIFDAADANRDKTLDEKEFNAALKLAPSAVPDGPDRQGRIQAARAKFRQLDKDNSHFITKEEVMIHPNAFTTFLRSPGEAPEGDSHQALTPRSQAKLAPEGGVSPSKARVKGLNAEQKTSQAGNTQGVPQQAKGNGGSGGAGEAMGLRARTEGGDAGRRAGGGANGLLPGKGRRLGGDGPRRGIEGGAMGGNTPREPQDK